MSLLSPVTRFILTFSIINACIFDLVKIKEKFFLTGKRY
jgi:hypothetical protein